MAIVSLDCNALSMQLQTRLPSGMDFPIDPPPPPAVVVVAKKCVLIVCSRWIDDECQRSKYDVGTDIAFDS